ncbi:MAG: DedA family protein [Nanoarchaeota archaeon]
MLSFQDLNGYPVLFTYALVFLAALIETAPFIGLFIPGQIFVILAGIAAYEGWVNFYLLVLFAAVGGILGDWIGFRLGSLYGEKWLKKYPKLFMLEHLPYKRAKKYFKKYGGVTIILGRFYGVTRAFTPFIAGTAKMKRSSFLFYNILGGFFWSYISVGIGYVFGETYPVIEKTLGRIFLILLVTLLVAFFLYSKYRSIRKKSR